MSLDEIFPAQPEETVGSLLRRPTLRGGLLAFAIAASLVALGYAFYTQQVWEDSLITLRHGENLIKGAGLVYNPGERVHGFTSPINVLLLALCYLLTGQQASYEATIWLYRVFTIGAFAGGGVLVLKAAYQSTPRWLPALWFLGLMYALDAKSVAYSTNGMETGFVLLFLGWAVFLLSLADPSRWLARGLSWAGLMWSRPDGCVYIAALALAELMFVAALPRRATLKSLAKSAGLGALVYAPWFLWAWSYYGSPVPHTIIAKANVGGATVQLLSSFDYLPYGVLARAAASFRPIYFGSAPHGDVLDWLPQPGWGRLINAVTKALGLVGLLYWMFPVRDRCGRALSFCFMLACLYFSFMETTFLWYYPPATLLGLATLSRAIATWTRASSEQTALRHRLAWATIAVLVLGQLLVFGLTTHAQQVQQAEIEMGNRARIGTWLKEHGGPQETVFLEPLGYVGYFSGLHMLDYPGLVAPEVVRLRHEMGLNATTIIPQLLPDWVVLRIVECQFMAESNVAAKFLKYYRAVQVFNVNDQLNQVSFMPGAQWLRYDACFVVFRKIEPPSDPSPAGGPAAAVPPSSAN